MPICIAGMHRSATSMVARLLNVCGVYLGPKNDLAAAAFDNEAGFWENLHFVKLNDDILAQLDGGWDLPPVLTEGWESQEKLAGLRGDATKLIRQFGPHKLWGWKDPRNTITFPFWRQLIPDLKVVVCLRNPMEVAQSLHKRSHASKAFGLNLWLLYHQQLLASTQPGERIITHYDAYFYDPQAELQRILNFLNIHPPPRLVEKACSTVSLKLRHSWVRTRSLTETGISGDLLDCYMKMCNEAEMIYQTSADEVR